MQELELADEPAGFADTVLDGEVVSHVQPVSVS